jgi:hypothetical protein
MTTIATRVLLRYAREFATGKALKQYLREHPQADRSKHTVSKGKGGPSPEPKKKYNAYTETPKQDIQAAKKRAKDTKWSKPSLEHEEGEVKRTAETLKIPPKKLLSAFDGAKVEALSDKDWSRLENTDSYDTDTFEKADALAREYDRGIAKVVKGMGGTLPAPIVLFRKGEPPYLVGGNTRLMAARAFGAKPQVLALRLS